jgi:hypothetical protein
LISVADAPSAISFPWGILVKYKWGDYPLLCRLQQVHRLAHEEVSLSAENESEKWMMK